MPINQHSSPGAKNLKDSTAPVVSKSLDARPMPSPPACQAIPPSPGDGQKAVPFLRKGTPFPCMHFFKSSCFLPRAPLTLGMKWQLLFPVAKPLRPTSLPTSACNSSTSTATAPQTERAEFLSVSYSHARRGFCFQSCNFRVVPAGFKTDM